MRVTERCQSQRVTHVHWSGWADAVFSPQAGSIASVGFAYRWAKEHTWGALTLQVSLNPPSFLISYTVAVLLLCFFHCTTNLGICTSWEGGSYHFWSDSEEELKSLLMRVKEESEKAGLKLNIQKINIMASGPITSWHIEGKKLEAVKDFLFLGSKITADSDCSHEIKRLLLLERYDKPRSV